LQIPNNFLKEHLSTKMQTGNSS